MARFGRSMASAQEVKQALFGVRPKPPIQFLWKLIADFSFIPSYYLKYYITNSKSESVHRSAGMIRYSKRKAFATSLVLHNI
jgi:hypothetical protein